MATPHSRRLTAVTAVTATSVVLIVAGAVWAGHAAWAAFTGKGTPSCAWPLQVRGKFTTKQVGLVRCYLKALAHRDAAGLLAVAEGPVRITKADLVHSADARAGTATATFTPNPSDTTNALVLIAYADGARDRLSMQNLIAAGGPYSWRLAIGSPLSPAPTGPPTAGPGN